MKKTILIFATTILVLSNCNFSFALKNKTIQTEEHVFLIVFAPFELSKKIVIEDEITKIDGFKVLRFCETKNAFLCTADVAKYADLVALDRIIHKTETTLPVKSFIKMLTQNDINTACQ